MGRDSPRVKRDPQAGQGWGGGQRNTGSHSLGTPSPWSDTRSSPSRPRPGAPAHQGAPRSPQACTLAIQRAPPLPPQAAASRCGLGVPSSTEVAAPGEALSLAG